MIPKTAPDTPLTGAFIVKVVQEPTEIPAGVFNVIISRDKSADGEALTGDPERVWRIAARLKAAPVNIGPSFYLSPDTPFGGYGISGVGREHGEDDFQEYLQAKTVASPAGC